MGTGLDTTPVVTEAKPRFGVLWIACLCAGLMIAAPPANATAILNFDFVAAQPPDDGIRPNLRDSRGDVVGNDLHGRVADEIAPDQFVVCEVQVGHGPSICFNFYDRDRLVRAKIMQENPGDAVVRRYPCESISTK